MAEVAVIAATVATLTLLLNLYERTTKGIDQYRQRRSIRKKFNDSLKIGISQLENWAIFFRIHAEVPEGFHDYLWGPRGCEILHVSMRDINAIASKLGTEMEQIFGDDSTMWLSWENLKNFLLPRYKSLQKHLNDLDEHIKNHFLQSQELMRSQHQSSIGFNDENRKDLSGWIDESFVEIYFASVEQKSTRYSDVLYQECHRDNGISELCLSELIKDPAVRANALTIPAAHSVVPHAAFDDPYSSAVSYKFFAQSLFHLYAAGFRCVRVRALHDHGFCGQCRFPEDWPFGMEEIETDPLHFNLTPQEVNRNGCFFEFAVCRQASNIAFSSLYSLLLQEHNCFVQKVHGYQARIERSNLAYQLARFTFLTIRTDWAKQACICTCLYQNHRPHGSYKYSIRIGQNVDHVRNRHRRLRWCGRVLNDMPIRRLGLILSEIALGVAIDDVYFDRENYILSVRLPATGNRSQPTQSPRPEAMFPVQLKEEVRQATDDSDYAEVVGWCLTQRHEPFENESSVNNASGRFYHMVLRPLYIKYLAEVVRDHEPSNRAAKRLAREKRVRNG